LRPLEDEQSDNSDKDEEQLLELDVDYGDEYDSDTDDYQDLL
jgi:allophanate hydrolase subunit 1